MTLLRAVLNQCEQYKNGVRIRAVDLENTMTIYGNYINPQNLKYPGGSWVFEVLLLRSDRALIRFHVVGEGYIGKLQKLDGNWVATRWRLLWTG